MTENSWLILYKLISSQSYLISFAWFNFFLPNSYVNIFSLNDSLTFIELTKCPMCCGYVLTFSNYFQIEVQKDVVLDEEAGQQPMYSTRVLLGVDEVGYLP